MAAVAARTRVPVSESHTWYVLTSGACYRGMYVYLYLLCGRGTCTCFVVGVPVPVLW